MNLDNLTNEIKERVQEGTKPSDLKKKRGRPSKQNISENEETGVKQEITSRLTQLRDNENEIRQMFEEWIRANQTKVRELDDNLAIFAAKLGGKVENLEKSSQVSLWKIMAWSILAISSGIAGLTSSYCAFKMWNS